MVNRERFENESRVIWILIASVGVNYFSAWIHSISIFDDQASHGVKTLGTKFSDGLEIVRVSRFCAVFWPPWSGSIR